MIGLTEEVTVLARPTTASRILISANGRPK